MADIVKDAKVKDPSYTYFEEVYFLFLSEVDSYEFAKMENDELENVLHDYLMQSMLIFSNYVAKDFSDFNDEEKHFNFKMTIFEKNILAKSMKLHWIEIHKSSEELMRKAIGDRDYTAVQGYKYLDSLLDIEKNLRKELHNDINRLEYGNVDLYGDMS